MRQRLADLDAGHRHVFPPDRVPREVGVLQHRLDYGVGQGLSRPLQLARRRKARPGGGERRRPGEGLGDQLFDRRSRLFTPVDARRDRRLLGNGQGCRWPDQQAGGNEKYGSIEHQLLQKERRAPEPSRPGGHTCPRDASNQEDGEEGVQADTLKDRGSRGRLRGAVLGGWREEGRFAQRRRRSRRRGLNRCVRGPLAGGLAAVRPQGTTSPGHPRPCP